MDRVEQAVVRQSLRLLIKARIIRSNNEASERLLATERLASFEAPFKIAKKNPVMISKEVQHFVYTQSVSVDAWESICESALDIIVEEIQQTIDYLGVQNADTLRYVCGIVYKYRKEMLRKSSGEAVVDKVGKQAGITGAANTIFRNWSQPPKSGYGTFRSGWYQIFRRYKPTRRQKNTKSKHDWSQDKNHAVICELLHLDLLKMECKLVTGDLNIYHGSICVTHERIMYLLLQRLNENESDIHQRFISSRLEHTKYDVYSGIMLKIGDRTIRPIASDIFYIFLEGSRYQALYDDLKGVFEREWHDTSPLAEDSEAASFIAITPPKKAMTDPSWKRVRFLKDFKLLLDTGLPTEDYIALFREPLRSLGADNLDEVLENNTLEVFRQ